MASLNMYWTVFLIASVLVSLSLAFPVEILLEDAPSPSSAPPPMPHSMPPSPSSVNPPPSSMPPSPSIVNPPPYSMPPSPSSVIPPPSSMPPSPSIVNPPPYSMPPSPSSVIPPPQSMPYPFPPPSSVVSPPPAVASTGGIKGGYWFSWLAEENPPSAIPTQYFTHLFYFHVTLDASTYQLFPILADVQWMPIFTATLHAKTPPAKAILSIGGGPSILTVFSNMAKSNQTRSTFVKSSIEVARKYGFDGLDLDWEFPNTTQDMSNLAALFQEWRQAIELESKTSGRPQLSLSAVVYYAADLVISTENPIFYPGGAIRSYVDFVNQRSFDYHGSWDTSVTAEPALVFDKSSKFTTSYGVDSWSFHGVFGEQLVMGLPLYGRTWKLKDPNQNGIGAPAAGVGPGDNGIMLYKDIEDYNLANHAAVVYDNSIAMYSYAGSDWIGYDGPISIQGKIEYAKSQGYKGYFFWAIEYDKNWTLSRIASSAWDA